MNKFCSNCGKELMENAAVCLNCGVLVKNNIDSIQQSNNKYNLQKTVVPKKGFAITSMILGIVACFWSFCDLCSINNIDSELYYLSSAGKFGFAIGYTLFSLIPSIIGLIFAVLSRKENKNKFNTSGLVLNIISLSLAIIFFTIIITY